MLNVLFMTPRAPVTLDRGDTTHAYHLIRETAPQAHIHLVTWTRSDDEARKLNERLGPYCRSIRTVPWSSSRAFTCLFKSTLNPTPFQVSYFNQGPMKRIVQETIQAESIDLIHAHTVRLASYFWNTPIPRIMNMSDAMSLNMDRRAEHDRWFLGPLLRNEARALRRYETKTIARYEATAVVSENDKVYLNNNRIAVIPNGTDITADRLAPYSKTSREDILLFQGNMSYFPNVAAVTHFARELWPEIRRRHPGYRFVIAGGSPAPEVRALHGRDGIEVTGFVEDMCEWLCRTRLGVYPLTSGTGMQFKVIEAMAAGLPVVAYPMALQGLEGVGPDQAAIADSPEAFVEEVDRLIRDREARRKLANTAQSYVRDRYTWECTAQSFLDLWRDIARG
jgi:glycosyltransferase involved in cell wall biosynthesis